MKLIAALLISTGLAAACSSDESPTAPESPTVASSTTTTTPTTGPTQASFCPTADGVNDAGACNADTDTYCAGFNGADWQAFARANGYTTASWKYGLVDCLNKNNVSAACHASLDRRELLNTQMMSACQAYCRGTSPTPGSEPCVDQLKSVYDTLDKTCRAALDAHEGAKPLDGAKCGI